MPFCWPSYSLLFFVFNYFPFLFFSSIGWQCGAGVFELIGCQSPSPGLALPIFINNNNNNHSCFLSLYCFILALLMRKYFSFFYSHTECSYLPGISLGDIIILQNNNSVEFLILFLIVY